MRNTKASARMRLVQLRSSEFIRKLEEATLLEQDMMGGGDGEAPAVDYKPPKERLLAIPDAADTQTEHDASLDEVVDKYFLAYEKEATGLSDQAGNDTQTPPGLGAEPVGADDEELGADQDIVSEMFKLSAQKNLARWLFSEQMDPAGGAPPPPPDPAGGMGGGPPPDGGMGGMGGMDMGGGDPMMGDGPPSDEQSDSASAAETVPTPKINIKRFADGVARLATNFNVLLDPKSVITNRAMYYIAKNYSPRLAKELVSILERDYKLSAKTQTQKSGESKKAPLNALAGPDSGGVPSGGGS